MYIGRQNIAWVLWNNCLHCYRIGKVLHRSSWECVRFFTSRLAFSFSCLYTGSWEWRWSTSTSTSFILLMALSLSFIRVAAMACSCWRSDSNCSNCNCKDTCSGSPHPKALPISFSAYIWWISGIGAFFTSMPRIYLHTLSLVWSSIQFSQQAVEKKVHQSYMTARFTVKRPKDFESPACWSSLIACKWIADGEANLFI